MCKHVYMCEREREREGGMEGGRERERERERERQVLHKHIVRCIIKALKGSEVQIPNPQYLSC